MKNKLLSTIMAIVITFSLTTLVNTNAKAVQEDTFNDGILTYKVLTYPANGNFGTVQIGNDSYGSGLLDRNNTSVTIPATVTDSANGYTYNVTSIGKNAFFDCDSLTTVNLENATELTGIGYGAFQDCKSLATVDLIKAVKLINIEKWAFGYSGLTNITIPISLKNINEYAFDGCNLKKFEVDPNNTTFTAVDGVGLLSKDKKKLIHGVCGDVVILEGVEEIGLCAFCNSDALGTVELPASVNNIHYYAFYGCTVKNFKVNSANKNFTAIDGVGLLSKDKKKLIHSVYGDIIIPKGVEVIGKAAFCGSNSLTSILLPDSITTIEQWAFLYSKISNITISSSVNDIHDFAFDGCNLKQITVDPANEYFTSVDGVGLLSKDKKNLIHGVGGDVVIPEGVEAIEDSAFWGCTTLVNVKLPKSLTNISNGSFGFTGLTSISIPSGVTTIGNSVFADGTDLGWICIHRPQEGMTLGKSWNGSCANVYFNSSYTIESETPSTCIEDGCRIKKCSRCGDEITEKIASSGNHTLGSWEIEKSPTTTEEGKRIQRCTVCGEIVNSEILEKIQPTEESQKIISNSKNTGDSFPLVLYTFLGISAFAIFFLKRKNQINK